MRGVQYVMNDQGDKTAVLIDLKIHGEVWEDFCDVTIVHDREHEPRESLASVKKRINRDGKR